MIRAEMISQFFQYGSGPKEIIYQVYPYGFRFTPDGIICPELLKTRGIAS